MIEQIEIGPFSLFFSNTNSEMGLRGHSHFAVLSLVYATLARTGLPVFEDVYADFVAYLKTLTARPFKDATNEQVARLLWDALDGWAPASARRYLTSGQAPAYGVNYRLDGLALSVRGVPDAIGHADAFSTYRITRA